jgi:hypothetical protein
MISKETMVDNMDKKKLQETYGMDIANYVKGVEEKQSQEQQAINNKQPLQDKAQLVLDKKMRREDLKPQSFPTQEEIDKTHKYVGEIELDGGNGNYWTVLQGPQGFIAGSPTNSGIMFDTDYFESIEELYEYLQQNPKYKEEEPYPDNLRSKVGK